MEMWLTLLRHMGINGMDYMGTGIASIKWPEFPIEQCMFKREDVVVRVARALRCEHALAILASRVPL